MEEIMIRPTLYGNRQAVSAGHYLAAAAGNAILDAGGNAIDAGCCAGIALAVLHPDQVNFAGVAPIIIRLTSGEVVTIAGLGSWSKSIDANIFVDSHKSKMPVGSIRTVVPAAPDAWITALELFGTMSFGEISKAAIEYARDGFSVDAFLESALLDGAKHYRKWPTSASLYLPQNETPRQGERFVQSDLANLIQFMADEEKTASTFGRTAGLEAARTAFYKGDIAEKIVSHVQNYGGYLTLADLAEHKSMVYPPVTGRWRNFCINTCGPWCQGPTLIQCLNMLDKVDISNLKHNCADYLHLFAEVIKLSLIHI